MGEHPLDSGAPKSPFQEVSRENEKLRARIKDLEGERVSSRTEHCSICGRDLMPPRCRVAHE